MQRKRIWIDHGCIHCFWCQNLMPQVFLAHETGTQIAGEAREDGVTSDNLGERSPLRTAMISPEELNFVPFIADGCPVQVIHLEGDWSDLGVVAANEMSS
jgi:ferredoxin